MPFGALSLYVTDKPEEREGAVLLSKLPECAQENIVVNMSEL